MTTPTGAATRDSTVNERENKAEKSTDINYADLDFITEGLGTKSTPPIRQSESPDQDGIEYAVINIVATEAVRKASEDQVKYREQRHAVSAH